MMKSKTTCNFYSVMSILRRYAKQQYVKSQRILVDLLFGTYVQHCTHGGFETSRINRWLNGVVPVPSSVADFYEGAMKESLTKDIYAEILPALSDIAATIAALHTLVMSDRTLSKEQKQILLQSFPCETAEAQASLIGEIVLFAISRPRQYH